MAVRGTRSDAAEPGPRIFPWDRTSRPRPGRALDLYARTWEGKDLGKRDFVISADEKTSIQADQRRHPTLAPASRPDIRVVHEYDRGGALAYLAAWDVHRARSWAAASHHGIEPLGRLVEQVMGTERYASARRVSWASTWQQPPRPRSVDRMPERWPDAWPGNSYRGRLLLTRSRSLLRHPAQVLTPNDSPIWPRSSPGWPLPATLRGDRHAFEWRFTRSDLTKLLERLAERPTTRPPPDPPGIA